jgi:hypothetical protein
MSEDVKKELILRGIEIIMVIFYMGLLNSGLITFNRLNYFLFIVLLISFYAFFSKIVTLNIKK